MLKKTTRIWGEMNFLSNQNLNVAAHLLSECLFAGGEWSGL